VSACSRSEHLYQVELSQRAAILIQPYNTLRRAGLAWSPERSILVFIFTQLHCSIANHRIEFAEFPAGDLFAGRLLQNARAMA